MVLGTGVRSPRAETPPSQGARSGRAATGSGDAAIGSSRIVCSGYTAGDALTRILLRDESQLWLNIAIHVTKLKRDTCRLSLSELFPISLRALKSHYAIPKGEVRCLDTIFSLPTSFRLPTNAVHPT